MREYYATTYDVCCGEILADMNTFKLENIDNLEEQAYKYAKLDRAYLVEIWFIEDGIRKTLDDIVFHEFKCDCDYVGQIDDVDDDE